MRQARQKQLTLSTDWLAFDHAKELQAIAGLLDEHPTIAEQKKIENGKRVRVDTTVVESNIHTPLDSNLLWDCVRVLTRVMEHCRELLGAEVRFPNRTRRARRRALGILNARFKEKRKPLYRDLLAVAKETVQSAGRVVEVVERALAGGTADLFGRLHAE